MKRVIRTILMMVLLTIALDAVAGLFESSRHNSSPQASKQATLTTVVEHHALCLSDLQCEISGHCHSPAHNRAFTQVILPSFSSSNVHADFYSASISIELPTLINRPPIS